MLLISIIFFFLFPMTFDGFLKGEANMEAYKSSNSIKNHIIYICHPYHQDKLQQFCRRT